MRFGIMENQVGALIPPGLTPDRAVQHIGTFTQAPLVRQLAEAGFKLIELGGDLSLFFPRTFSPPDIEELAALKRELGLSYTAHLPLWSVEPSSPCRPVREGSVRAVIDIIRATRPLEPETYAFHMTGALAAEFYHMPLAQSARPLLMQLFANNALESVKTVLGETGLPSRKLAIETVEFPFELLLQVAEALDTSITFDTGHVLAGFSGPVDFFAALEQALPRLGEVHLHDSPSQGLEHTIRYGLDHQTLGRGDLDLGRFLDALAAARFEGPIIMELMVKEALESLDAIRSIRPDAIS